MKKTICIALAALMLCACLAGCGGGGKKVVIASKQFTENILLSEMYAQLIENKTDIAVERKQNLGGTSVCYPAMEKGEIDMYLEYTGTAYNEILKLDADPSIKPDEIYAIVKEKMDKEKGITIYGSLGLNNTFALAMIRSKAEALGVKTMSDLAPVSADLIFGANHLFYTRVYDGYDSMVEKYGTSFKDAMKMDTSLLYDATVQGQVDVMVVYATDSLLKKYDMVVLQDDKQMFPAYYGTPMIRNDTLKKYPELAGVLDLLTGRIGDERMQELNYQIDVENKQPSEVAAQFLKEEGLI